MDRITVELPAPLVELFEQEGGDLCARLGEAVSAGLGPAAQVREPDPPEDSEEALARYRKQLLLHYFGSYWYYATEVAILRRDMAELEGQIRAYGGDPT